MVDQESEHKKHLVKSLCSSFPHRRFAGAPIPGRILLETERVAQNFHLVRSLIPFLLLSNCWNLTLSTFSLFLATASSVTPCCEISNIRMIVLISIFPLLCWFLSLTEPQQECCRTYPCSLSKVTKFLLNGLSNFLEFLFWKANHQLSGFGQNVQTFLNNCFLRCDKNDTTKNKYVILGLIYLNCSSFIDSLSSQISFAWVFDFRNRDQ